jgi:hypothetical protein
VLQIVRDAGIPVRKPGKATPRPRTLSDAEIIRRYREGQPGPQIADAASVTPNTIYRVLRTYGVAVRPPLTPNGGRKKAHDG